MAPMGRAGTFGRQFPRNHQILYLQQDWPGGPEAPRAARIDPAAHGPLFWLKSDTENPGEWAKSGNGVLGKWSGRPLASIAKHDAIALLDGLVDSGRRYSQPNSDGPENLL
jgi:hypothetical protein